MKRLRNLPHDARLIDERKLQLERWLYIKSYVHI